MDNRTDEFPASASILFDSNASQGSEELEALGGLILHRINDAASKPVVSITLIGEEIFS